MNSYDSGSEVLGAKKGNIYMQICTNNCKICMKNIKYAKNVLCIQKNVFFMFLLKNCLVGFDKLNYFIFKNKNIELKLRECLLKLARRNYTRKFTKNCQLAAKITITSIT